MEDIRKRLEEEAIKIYEKVSKIYQRVYKPNAGNNSKIFGDFMEDIAIGLINENISDNLHVAQGLIRRKDEKLSPQIDIIIYSGKAFYKCDNMETAIIDSCNVRAIVEVKAYLDKTTLEKIGKQISEIKKYCSSNAKSLIFTAELVGSIEEENLKNKLEDECDGFVILRKKKKRRTAEYTYDYGSGLSNFIEILKNI